jgi:putative ABC transport system ATP-binding protein
MLEINDINLTFHEGTSREVKALKHVNLAIEKGSFTLLLGSNGSGKSTLLNILAGTLLPNSGKVMLNGKELQNEGAYLRSPYIARVFQNPTLGTAPDLTLIDNFRIASLRTQSKGLKIGINAAFRKKVADHVSILNLGLENRLDQLMGSFSGGQRQALSLLMATFDTLDLLLLDEPTAALDPRSADLVLNLATRIIKEKNLTAIMVTHELQHCIKVGDRIIQLDQGEVIRDIAGQQKSSLRLDEVFTWFA